MPKKAPKNKGGRPPAGPHGEEVRDYRHQFATRVPGSVFHLVRNIKTVTGVSYRELLTDALTLYLQHRVTSADRALIEESATASERNCPECKEERKSRG